MRYLSFLLIAMLLFTACRKNNTDKDRSYYQNFEYRPGWEITFIPDTIPNQQFGGYTTRKNADYAVFVYSYGFSESNIPDGGHGIAIWWQVPDTATYFKYTDQQLAARQTFTSTAAGYVPRLKTQLIDKGTIEGRRKGQNTWEINIDIMLPEKDATLNVQHIQHKADYTVKY